MVFVAILLISKTPTYSFKKISINRSMTIFLLLGVGLFFVLIIQFTFETLTICLATYLILIPVSILNYKKNMKNTEKIKLEEDQQDIL